VGVFATWREARRRREMAARYLAAVDAAGGATAPSWLAGAASPGADADREWRWAVRAVGLIVAERDALDDRTVADVSHVVDAGLGGDRAAWRERQRRYAEALARRGGREAPLTRVARALLDAVGAGNAAPERIAEAARQLTAVRIAANEALRAAFGAVSLPEDEAPSAAVARGAR
jgi:hypothetical protein